MGVGNDPGGLAQACAYPRVCRPNVPRVGSGLGDRLLPGGRGRIVSGDERAYGRRIDTWLARITAVLEGDRRAAPYALNLIVRSEGAERFKSDLAAVRRFRPVIVITSVGAPNLVVDLVHGYGGRMIDAPHLKQARKILAMVG